MAKGREKSDMASEDADDKVEKAVDEESPISATEKGDGEAIQAEVEREGKGAQDVTADGVDEVEMSVQAESADREAAAASENGDEEVSSDEHVSEIVDSSISPALIAADDVPSVRPKIDEDGGWDLASEEKDEEPSNGVTDSSVQLASQGATERFEGLVPSSVESEISGKAASSPADEVATGSASESTETEAPALAYDACESAVKETSNAAPDAATEVANSVENFREAACTEPEVAPESAAGCLSDEVTHISDEPDAEASEGLSESADKEQLAVREQAVEAGDESEQVTPSGEAVSADEGLAVVASDSGREEPSTTLIESALEEPSTVGAESINEEPRTLEAESSVADERSSLANVVSEAEKMLKTEMTDEEAMIGATEHSVEDTFDLQLQTEMADEEVGSAAISPDEADALEESGQAESTDAPPASEIPEEADTISEAQAPQEELHEAPADIKEAAQGENAVEESADAVTEAESEAVLTLSPESADKEDLARPSQEDSTDEQLENIDEKAPDAAPKSINVAEETPMASSAEVDEVSVSPEHTVALSEDAEPDEAAALSEETVVAITTPLPVDEELSSLSDVSEKLLESGEGGAENGSLRGVAVVGEKTSDSVEEDLSVFAGEGHEEVRPLESVSGEMDTSEAAEVQPTSLPSESVGGEELDTTNEAQPESLSGSVDEVTTSCQPEVAVKERAVEAGDESEQVTPSGQAVSADEGLAVVALDSGREEPTTTLIESALEEPSTVGAESINEEPRTLEPESSVADESSSLANVVSEAEKMLKTEMTDEEAMIGATEHSVEDTFDLQLQTERTDEEVVSAATERFVEDISDLQLQIEMTDEEAMTAATEHSVEDTSDLLLRTEMTDEEVMSAGNQRSVEDTSYVELQTDVDESLKSAPVHAAKEEGVASDVEESAGTSRNEVSPSEVSRNLNDVGLMSSFERGEKAPKHVEVSGNGDAQDQLNGYDPEPVVDEYQAKLPYETAVDVGAASGVRREVHEEPVDELDNSNRAEFFFEVEGPVVVSNSTDEDELLLSAEVSGEQASSTPLIVDRGVPVVAIVEDPRTNEAAMGLELVTDAGFSTEKVASTPVAASIDKEELSNPAEEAVEESLNIEIDENETIAAPEAIYEKVAGDPLLGPGTDVDEVAVSLTPGLAVSAEGKVLPASEEIVDCDRAALIPVEETSSATSAQPALEKEVATIKPQSYNLDEVASSLHATAEKALEQSGPSSSGETQNSLVQNVAHIVLEESNKIVDSSREYIAGVVQKVGEYGQEASQSADPNMLRDTVARVFEGETASTPANQVTQPKGTASLGTMVSLFVIWCVSLCASHIGSKDVPAPALELAAEEVASVLHANGPSGTFQESTTSH